MDTWEPESLLDVLLSTRESRDLGGSAGLAGPVDLNTVRISQRSALGPGFVVVVKPNFQQVF